MTNEELIENIPNFEKNEFLRKQIEKCDNPFLYSKIFKYKIYQKKNVDEEKLKKLRGKRYLLWTAYSSNRKDFIIIVTGKTIGNYDLEINYLWSGKYDRKCFHGAISKWSKEAFKLEYNYVGEHLRRIWTLKNQGKEKYDGSYEYAKVNIEKYPKSSNLANKFGYKLSKDCESNELNEKSKTLCYSYLKDGSKFRIRIVGIMKNGKKLSVDTKAYYNINDTYLTGAIRKWLATSGKLEKMRSKSKCRSN